MANVVLWCLVCVWVLLFCGCLVFGLFLVPFAFLHALALVHSAQTAVSRAKKKCRHGKPSLQNRSDYAGARLAGHIKWRNDDGCANSPGEANIGPCERFSSLDRSSAKLGVALLAITLSTRPPS